MSSGWNLQVKGCKPVCSETTFSLHSGKSCTFTADRESLCDKLAQVNLLAQLGMHGCDAMRQYIHPLNYQIMCWALEVCPNHVKMKPASSQHVVIPRFSSGHKPGRHLTNTAAFLLCTCLHDAETVLSPVQTTKRPSNAFHCTAIQREAVQIRTATE